MQRLNNCIESAIVLFICTSVCSAQQAFDLDPAFEFSGVNEFFVSSVLALSNGGLILAGQMKDPPGLPLATYGLLQTTNTGQLDLSYDPSNFGRSNITPWNGKFYVSSTQTVRRMFMDGTRDYSFIEMNTGPYFGSLQGGDYHVYPDGRILMTGLHILQDSIRGFVGGYNLIWFTNTGYLDTTRTHRTSNGFVFGIEEQPDGKFLCTGTLTEYEGQPVAAVFRVHADGALDTTFNSPIFFGRAADYHTQIDGKVLVAGTFKYNANTPDTLGLLRLHPDGSLDNSFNIPEFQVTYRDVFARVLSIYALDTERYIVTGLFNMVDGQPRGGICVIDTAGNLLNDYFTGPGVGGWQNGQVWTQTIGGITPAPDGSYYIYGSYHGYDDGTNNYSGQRMVSRLYGLNVGVVEETGELRALNIHPNPTKEFFKIEIEGISELEQDLVVQIFDKLGRSVLLVSFERAGPLWIALSGQPPGVYYVQVRDQRNWYRTATVVIN